MCKPIFELILGKREIEAFIFLCDLKKMLLFAQYSWGFIVPKQGECTIRCINIKWTHWVTCKHI